MRDYFVSKIPSGEFVAWVAEFEEAIIGRPDSPSSKIVPGVSDPSGIYAYVMNVFTRVPNGAVAVLLIN